MTAEPRATPDFICEDCASPVFVVGGPHDGKPVCGTCRFIRERPDMPEEIKRTLRGEDDGDVVDVQPWRGDEEASS